MKQLFLVLLAVLAIDARAEFVTLTAAATNGVSIGVAELSIRPYEAAELVSYVGPTRGDRLQLFKDGKTIDCPFAPQTYPVIVAGPATFRYTALTNSSGEGFGPAFLTFRITPGAFPPDRTVIVLPGTNQTSVTLECSTNLVNWASATNGVYGPMPEAKFFRIKLQ